MSLCNITKNTLIWYEKKGLITPKIIGKNGFHYYSREQFFDIDLIKTLKWADKSLDDCKDYMDHRSEESYSTMLLEQQNLLEQKIAALFAQKRIIDRTIQDYLAIKTRYSTVPKVVTLQERCFLVEPIQENTPRGHIMAFNRLYEVFRSCLSTYGVAPSMLNSAIVS